MTPDEYNSVRREASLAAFQAVLTTPALRQLVASEAENSHVATSVAVATTALSLGHAFAEILREAENDGP